jgi:glycosyltransferase involved in cell wall biosynthesis
LKIAIVNTLLKGGASKSAQRLVIGLESMKIKVNFIIKNSKGCEQALLNKFEVLEKSNISKKALKYFKLDGLLNYKNSSFLKSRSEAGLDKFSFPNSKFEIEKSLLVQNSDLINLHWVADFLDYKSFFNSVKAKPIIWTLHDEAPFSFGQHYNEKLVLNSSDQLRVRIKTAQELKVEQKIRDFKLKVFEKVENLTVVGPSKWISDESRKSEIFSKYETHIIPNAVNTEIFRLWDKQICKRLFQIDDDRPSILFVADNLNDNRKGFRLLINALKNLNNEKLNFLIVGSGEFDKAEFEINHKLIFLNRVNDERMMSIIYNAADLFLLPSIMDNLPNTAIESICCGTPVIGFNVGGIPEIVKNGENGYLADSLDSENLSENILKGLRNISIFDNIHISMLARNKYKLEVQAKRYVELFQSKISC